MVHDLLPIGNMGGKRTFYLILLIASLVIIARFASDIYLPSFPFITKDLSTSFKLVQISISCYFFAVSISQLIYGVLSDIHGRKGILIIGLLLFIIGSILAIFSHSIWVFLLARTIQGAGMGASVSLARAIMGDSFTGSDLLKASSYISMAAALAPAVAPILGGYIQYFFNWEMNFIILLICTLLLLVFIIFFLKESAKKRTARTSQVMRSVLLVLKNKKFVFNAIFSFYMGVILIGYLTDSSFLFQMLLGYNETQYGLLAIYLVAGYLVGSFSGPYLVKYFGDKISYYISVFSLFAVSFLMLIINLIFPLSFYTIIPFITLLSLCARWISPRALASAMDAVSAESKGTGAALIGSVPLMGGGISSYIIAHFHYDSAAPLTIIIFVVSAAAVANLFFFRKCYTSSL